MQELRAAIYFPLTKNLERFAVEHENAAWPIAIGRSERTYINAFWPTVNSVRTRIVSARENFLRFDHFDDLWFSRIRLRVDDVNPRRPQPRHN